MAGPSPRGGSLECVDSRRTVVIVLGAVLLGIVTVATGGLGGQSPLSALERAIPTPGATAPFPLFLGLAAHGGTDRGSTLERLATELEGVASQLRNDRRSDEPARDRMDRIRDADVAIDADRDDELGRLADAVEELTTAVQERERQFAERERELRGTTERFRAVVEATPTALVAVDLDGNVELWNPAAERIFGWSAEEVRGEPLPIVPDDREAEVDRFLERLEANESITGVETQRLTRDGSLIDVSLSKAPLRDADGEVVGAMAALEDITERKETERQLRERERRLETYASFTEDLLDAVDDVFYVIDRDGDIQRWNASLVEKTGYSHDEIESMIALDFFAEPERETIADAIEEVFETGSTRVEARSVTADGESIPFEFFASRLEDLEGDTVVVGIGRDISERKRYERNLEHTTRLLEQSQRLANIGAWEIDVRDEPYDLHWTDEVARIHGLSPDERVDLEQALDYYHPDDRAEIRTAVERAIETGESYDLELRLVPNDGEQRWVRTIGEPVREDGDVVTVQGSFQDITDRKRRERELERYETIVQALDELVYTLDGDGNFRFLNDAAQSISGYNPEDLIGKDVASMMAQKDLETAQNLIRDLLRADEPSRTFEMDLETADGEVIETENHMALLPMDDGEFAGTAGVIRDITERKERERELERTTELLEQAQRIAGVGGWELDVTTDPYELTVTTELQQLFGRERPHGAERDVADAIRAYHPDDRPRVLSAVDDAVENGESYDLEVRMYTADGEERWMRTIGEPVFADGEGPDDGEVVAVRGSVQDITERKERERDLERTTDLLERVQRMAQVGGWEVDVTVDPPSATWTEELYRLHDLPRDVTPTLETTIECYHPEDRPFVRQRLETATATESGYDLEGRLLSDAGDVRWVRAIGEPIFDEDGALIKYRGSVKDISDRKRRELALESLHETARSLLNTESESAVADLVTDTAADLLESGSAGVYMLDAETNRFEPVASTADFADRSGGAPSVAVGDGNSVLWNTYVTGTQTVVDDAEIGDRSPLFGGDVPGGLLVPIGDHGVFVVIAQPAAIDDETRQLVETLVATTEAAFDRLESEASLRERDAELEAQNRRLRRQIQVTEIIRGIDRSLIGTDSRDEIERTVPERLIEADNVAFAWIGDLDASGTALVPRNWAGSEPEYLDDLALDLETEPGEPSVRAARSEAPTVVENVVEELQRESWRTNALDAGFQSVISVPLSFEEYSYGVLSVYADEPDAFTDLERTVLGELGEGIANAITAAKTQEALHAETLVELTLSLEGDDILSRIATATEATVTYEGLGTHSGSETVLFFETSGTPPDDVCEVLDDLVSVADYRLISDSDPCLFEATVTGDVVASRLVRHGGSPRSITADGERTAITVDVPTTTDVREFVEMLEDHYAGVDLQSRRHVQRAMHTRQELVTSLFEDLTDRQLEVLRTAYLAGFFEWPRESTGEEIAEMLEVTQPTINRHLRIGQQRLLEQLFENGTISVVDES